MVSSASSLPLETLLSAADGTHADVENYFAEQPSGRNLLHVLPPGVSPGAAVLRGGTSGGRGGRAPGEAEVGAAQGSRNPMASFREAPSGRGLLNDNDSVMSSLPAGPAGHGGSVYVSEPSEGSGSAWNDSDAQSGYPYGTTGEGRGSAYQTEAASAYPSSETASEAFVGAVGLTEDDLEVSEGSAAASRLGGEGGGGGEGRGGARRPTERAVYGSESTYEERSIIGGESYMSESPASRQPGRQQAMLQLHGSSNSSLASRVVGPTSEIGHQVPGPQISWRSSPMAEGFERMSSGDTTDSSVLRDQSRRRRQQGGVEDGGQQDGDFGSVWLANRAHARQYDEEPEGS